LGWGKFSSGGAQEDTVQLRWTIVKRDLGPLRDPNGVVSEFALSLLSLF